MLSSPSLTLPWQSVQTFGRKKTAVAVSYCKKGRGLIKINGCPIELVEPEVLRYKVFEPILLLGRERFANMDIRIRVKGGGYTSQIYGASIPVLLCRVSHRDTSGAVLTVTMVGCCASGPVTSPSLPAQRSGKPSPSRWSPTTRNVHPPLTPAEAATGGFSDG